MENANNKSFYTTIEAAKLLDVSVRTVQLWVERKVLDAWKTAGGHRRIDAKSVHDYLESQNPIYASPSNINRVLVVEDNPAVAKFYQAAIESWQQPIEVVCKQDGFEGLLEIGQSPPDLLISDIYMPGMDGLEMIRSLTKSQKFSCDKIIVISGLSDESISERGGMPSDVTFFRKPVSVDCLKQAVLDKLKLKLNVINT